MAEARSGDELRLAVIAGLDQGGLHCRFHRHGRGRDRRLPKLPFRVMHNFRHMRGLLHHLQGKPGSKYMRTRNPLKVKTLELQCKDGKRTLDEQDLPGLEGKMHALRGIIGRFREGNSEPLGDLLESYESVTLRSNGWDFRSKVRCPAGLSGVRATSPWPRFWQFALLLRRLRLPMRSRPSTTVPPAH